MKCISIKGIGLHGLVFALATLAPATIEEDLDGLVPCQSPPEVLVEADVIAGDDEQVPRHPALLFPRPRRGPIAGARRGTADALRGDDLQESR